MKKEQLPNTTQGMNTKTNNKQTDDMETKTK